MHSQSISTVSVSSTISGTVSNTTTLLSATTPRSIITFTSSFIRSSTSVTQVSTTGNPADNNYCLCLFIINFLRFHVFNIHETNTESDSSLYYNNSDTLLIVNNSFASFV